MTTQGIVIKKVDYLKDDAIITILTPSFGFISFLAKSANKLKNKNFACLNLLQVSEFYLFIRDFKKVGRLQKGYIIENYIEKAFLIETNQIFFILITLIFRCKENIKQTDFLYEKLHLFLKNFDQSPGHWTIWLLINLYQSINQKSFTIDRCSRCDNKSFIKTLSIYDNGFICKNCLILDRDKIYSLSFLKSFKLVHENYENIFLMSNKTLVKLFYFYSQYFESILGIKTYQNIRFENIIKLIENSKNKFNFKKEATSV